MIIVVAVMWLLLSVFTYGLLKGTFMKQFPMLNRNLGDEFFYTFIALFAPISLPIFLLITVTDRDTEHLTVRFKEHRHE